MDHENTHRQLASHSYSLPIEDQEFLLRDELRGIRFALEYSKTDLLLRDWGIRSTIIVFGSARVPSPEQAEALRAGALNGGDAKDAARRLSLAPYYEEARKFGRIVSLQGGALNPKSGIRDNVIATGGGPGIMEAANRGAHEAGGKTIGLNIRLPFEQGANPYISEGLHFEFHYFFMRKFWFAYMAKALVVFPGGFGTLDEMFEILTLMQTEKLEKQIQIILYGSEYWDRILHLDPMSEWGAITDSDQALIRRADSPEQAFSLLRTHLTEHHLQPAKAPAISKTRS
jgi:uncharacterized protein (TIGR00730 family)